MAGNGGFVAGKQHALGQAGPPFDAAVDLGGVAVRGAVVGSDDGDGVARLGVQRPVGGGTAVAVGVEMHHEVDVDLRDRRRRAVRCRTV